MLGLASVAAVGTILEYRFRYNPFYDWAGQLPFVRRRQAVRPRPA